MIKSCPLKKCISKRLFHKNIPIFLSHSKIAPSKNVFQKRMSNCSLKIAPSKNAFQNCYKLSIGNRNQNPVGLKTLDM